MTNGSLLPVDKQIAALTDTWDAIRTCELNVTFHREKARVVSRRAKAIEVSSALLAAFAGIGILSGIKGVPDSIWAIVAFLSGIAGQLRSVFGLPELELKHRNLQNDYSSVLSSLKGMVDRSKDAGGLTFEVDTQRKLVFESSIS